MEQIISKIETVIKLMGFDGARVTIDEDHRKISIIIDDELVEPHVSKVLPAFNHLFNLILKKEALPPYIIDLNYYRKERERLIVELARAAAHKARLTKSDVDLPPMNAYERRIVHVEIAVNPELKTESIGEGRERRVLIKHIEG